MVSRVSNAFRFLSNSFPFDYEQRALIGYGLGGAVALEVVRSGALVIPVHVNPHAQSVPRTVKRWWLSRQRHYRFRERPSMIPSMCRCLSDTLVSLRLSRSPHSKTNCVLRVHDMRSGAFVFDVLTTRVRQVTRFSTAGKDVLADERSWARTRFLIKGTRYQLRDS